MTDPLDVRSLIKKHLQDGRPESPRPPEPRQPPQPAAPVRPAGTIYVTAPGNDDIGEILTSMEVPFEPFDGDFDCSILFVNCGTYDVLDPEELAEYVRSGGCVYASDHADDLVAQAFPGRFSFAGHGGSMGQVNAEVVDRELRGTIGSAISITFDLPSWAVMTGVDGHTILRAGGRPIMAYVTEGAGTVFYTCFHNRAQASDQEKRLLQLLVLKQISVTSRITVEEAGRRVGVDLEDIRRDFRR